MEDENPDDVYAVAEDPAPFEPEDINIVNLRDLQWNVINLDSTRFNIYIYLFKEPFCLIDLH
ncbi:hypothetical protein BDD43_4203 [Mucilaginibacter gracilis]|uniref:Uncharacterized protein n=1 Tax=Mucilaginibacter gracilis TaxID=423350 RepID=A0A495J4V2_9SPHI|nr:hypothetical protein [Mucilaginibacter gracilis]RKR83987.1 hypothetical protein BDD43_4203 [Mucilaginibacter gracilis]